MNDVVIRNATINDLEIVQELNNNLFKLEKDNYDSTLVSNWPLTNEGREYFTNLINNHCVLVTVIDRLVVGYLAGMIDEQGSYEEVQYGEINNMFVKDEYREYGIGKKTYR